MAPPLEYNDHGSKAHANSPFVHVAFKGGVLTARPSGPSLGEREASIVLSQIKEAIAANRKRLIALVLDLSDIQIMSSFGLGMCIELRNEMRERAAETILYGLNAQLTELFKMVKVDRLYKIARSSKELAQAIAA